MSRCTQGKEVEDNDVFHFNNEFSERLYRIKINAIQLKETVEENKKTNDQVLQDRQYQVGAPAKSGPRPILVYSPWTLKNPESYHCNGHLLSRMRNFFN